MVCSIMMVGSRDSVAKCVYYDYYGGPMGGFFCCRCCDRWYAFAATDHDDEWDVRLYILWEFEGVDLSSVCMRGTTEGMSEYWIGQSEWEVLVGQVTIGASLAGVVSQPYWPVILVV